MRHLLTGLEAGADWELTYSAFSLDQAHVEEGQAAVWDEPDRYPGLLVNLAGIVVRDRVPERFEPCTGRCLRPATTRAWISVTAMS